MSGALIPSERQAAAALAALPAEERGEVRRQALRMSGATLAALQNIRDSAKSETARVAAAKLILQVAALTSTTNLPRDVVKEKFEQTVDVIQRYVPAEMWAACAEDLKPIWSDV